MNGQCMKQEEGEEECKEDISVEASRKESTKQKMI
jgi:hypothetical protein